MGMEAMTVFYKRILSGAGGKPVPRRVMTRDDLGLSLLESPYDPDLLAIGIKAPKLTRTQTLVNRMKAAAAVPKKPMTDEKRTEHRDRARFDRTAAGIGARQEARAIIRKYRGLGEVRK